MPVISNDITGNNAEYGLFNSGSALRRASIFSRGEYCKGTLISAIVVPSSNVLDIVKPLKKLPKTTVYFRINE